MSRTRSLVTFALSLLLLVAAIYVVAVLNSKP